MLFDKKNHTSYIFGIGTDLVNINRFENHIKKTPLLFKRLFNVYERNLSLSIQSLASRFACKEAVFKILNSSKINWKSISIIKDYHGKPYVWLSKKAQIISKQKNIKNWHLSITHDKDYACAFVVAETE